MGAPLAILLSVALALVLFRLNRNRSARNWAALWIPVLWIGPLGSRPIADWFATDGQPLAARSNLDGSPLDAAAFAALLVMGVIVLVFRRRKTASYLAANIPIVVYFIYCLISVTWSPVPGPSLKRWIKDVGDLVMVLIVVTDIDPVAALRQLFSRVGFILFPLSIALIRYTTLGRAWDNDGNLSIVGVTTNKNMFGMILFVISLGVLWNVRSLFVNKEEPNRRQRLIAQSILLAIGFYLLCLSHSSTSLTCFLIGSGLMLVMHLPAFRRRPKRVSRLGLAIVAVGLLLPVLGASADVARLLGRDASFSGRTVIWAALIPTVSSPLIGTGFDSYWDSPNVKQFQSTLKSMGWYSPERLNEAHNGYLDVYLNLGWIGLLLILTILTVGYVRACKANERNRELGGLPLAYVVAGVFYSFTEAGFRTLSTSWFFILLAVVVASGANAGLLSRTTATLRASRRRAPGAIPFDQGSARRAI
jgi:exopolysaccharide production protein ExoQ